MNAAVSRQREASESRKIRILQSSPLFSALSDEGLTRLLAASELLTLERRHSLATMQQAGSAFVVGQGRLRARHHDEESRPLTLGYYGPGDLVGENAWSAQHRAGEIMAMEITTLLRLPLVQLHSLLSEEPTLALRLVELLTSRSVLLEERLASVLNRTVEQRIAEFISRLVKTHALPDERGILLGIRLTHQEIAAYVGSTRETVTLLLTDMKRRGMLFFDHRRIVVTDLPALEGLF